MWTRHGKRWLLFALVVHLLYPWSYQVIASVCVLYGYAEVGTNEYFGSVRTGDVEDIAATFAVFVLVDFVVCLVMLLAVATAHFGDDDLATAVWLWHCCGYFGTATRLLCPCTRACPSIKFLSDDACAHFSILALTKCCQISRPWNFHGT